MTMKMNTLGRECTQVTGGHQRGLRKGLLPSLPQRGHQKVTSASQDTGPQQTLPVATGLSTHLHNLTHPRHHATAALTDYTQVTGTQRQERRLLVNRDPGTWATGTRRQAHGS